MLEQKVEHVSAMKFFTDQESSRFQYVRGTTVIFVLVYCTANAPHNTDDATRKRKLRYSAPWIKGPLSANQT